MLNLFLTWYIVVISWRLSPAKFYNSCDLMGTRVVIQSATVVEEESSSTYTTITTITDATTVNGNKLRIMATRKIWESYANSNVRKGRLRFTVSRWVLSNEVSDGVNNACYYRRVFGSRGPKLKETYIVAPRT